MWLERNKSVSDVAKAPSDVSIVECSPPPIGKVEPRKYEDTASTNKQNLSHHLFCALFPFFGKLNSSCKDPDKENLESPTPPPEPVCEINRSDSSIGHSSKGRKSNSKTKLSLDISKSTVLSNKRTNKKKKRAESEFSIPGYSQSEDLEDSSVEYYHVDSESPDEEIISLIRPEIGEIYELLEIFKSEVDCLWKSSEVDLDFLNGNCYQGKIADGYFEGRGKYIWADKALYQGMFQASKASGEGNVELPNGMFYIGQLKDNLRQGDGFFFKCDNVTYNGQWDRGKKTRKGKLTYGDENWYEGDIINGKRTGVGLRHYPSNSRYHGEWKNGTRDGLGIMYWRTGELYNGEWVDGLMHGAGKLTWETFKNDQFVYPMQNYYQGEWKQGIRHGSGMLFLSTGAVIWTSWIDGVKNGPGRILCCNGTTVEADPLFVEDNLVVMCKVKSTYRREVNELKGSRSHFSIVDFFQDDEVIETPYNEIPTSCFVPINMPTYMMNLDFELNLFFSTEWTNRFNFNAELSSYYHACGDGDKKSMPEFLKTRLTAFKEHLELSDSKLQKDLSVESSSKSILGGGKKVTRKKYCEPDVKKVKPNVMKCFRKCPPQTTLVEVESDPEKEKKLSKKVPKPPQVNVKYLKKSSVEILTPPEADGPPFNEALNDYFEDIRKNMTDDMKIRAYRFERQWLRLSLMKYAAAFTRVYRRYSLICCTEEPPFEVGMMKIMLWRLLLDSGLSDARLSVVEMDRIAVGRVCDPFDFVPMSEMVHYLLVLSWHLVSKHGKGDPSIPGVFASGFHLFMDRRVIPATDSLHFGLFPLCNHVSLQALQVLFQSLRPSPTVKSLLLSIFKSNKKFEESILKPSVDLKPKKEMEGRNCILPGGGIYYQMDKEDSNTTVVAESVEACEHEINEPGPLEVFSDLGHFAVMDIIISCCPMLVVPGTDQLQQSHYELSFLEFCTIFVRLATSYASQTNPLYENTKAKLRRYLNLDMESRDSSQESKNESEAS